MAISESNYSSTKKVDGDSVQVVSPVSVLGASTMVLKKDQPLVFHSPRFDQESRSTIPRSRNMTKQSQAPTVSTEAMNLRNLGSDTPDASDYIKSILAAAKARETPDAAEEQQQDHSLSPGQEGLSKLEALLGKASEAQLEVPREEEEEGVSPVGGDPIEQGAAEDADAVDREGDVSVMGDEVAAEDSGGDEHGIEDGGRESEGEAGGTPIPQGHDASEEDQEDGVSEGEGGDISSLLAKSLELGTETTTYRQSPEIPPGEENLSVNIAQLLASATSLPSAHASAESLPRADESSPRNENSADGAQEVAINDDLESAASKSTGDETSSILANLLQKLESKEDGEEPGEELIGADWREDEEYGLDAQLEGEDAPENEDFAHDEEVPSQLAAVLGNYDDYNEEHADGNESDEYELRV
jgi:hypothetical protein